MHKNVLSFSFFVAFKLDCNHSLCPSKLDNDKVLKHTIFNIEPIKKILTTLILNKTHMKRKENYLFKIFDFNPSSLINFVFDYLSYLLHTLYVNTTMVKKLQFL